MPHWISSAISSALCLRASSVRGLQQIPGSPDGCRPRPAQIQNRWRRRCESNLRSRSATSLNCTNSTPGTSGANGADIFPCAWWPASQRCGHGKNAPAPESATWVLRPVRNSASGIGARQLERAFPGLGAAVGEESAVHAGNLRQALRQSPLILVVEQVRHVNQQLGLLRDRLGERRMRVAQRIHADPAQEVEILRPLSSYRYTPRPLRSRTGWRS